MATEPEDSQDELQTVDEREVQQGLTYQLYSSH